MVTCWNKRRCHENFATAIQVVFCKMGKFFVTFAEKKKNFFQVKN